MRQQVELAKLTYPSKLLNPAINTISYLHVLLAHIVGSGPKGKALSLSNGFASGKPLWQAMSKFMDHFDPIQIRYSGQEIRRLIEIIYYAGIEGQQVCFYRAIGRLQVLTGHASPQQPSPPSEQPSFASIHPAPHLHLIIVSYQSYALQLATFSRPYLSSTKTFITSLIRLPKLPRIQRTCSHHIYAQHMKLARHTSTHFPASPPN